jgi:hypothetical protein
MTQTMRAMVVIEGRAEGGVKAAKDAQRAIGELSRENAAWRGGAAQTANTNAQVQASLAGVAAGANAAGTAIRPLPEQVGRNATAYQRLKASLDQAYASELRWTQAKNTVALAIRNEGVSLAEANATMDAFEAKQRRAALGAGDLGRQTGLAAGQLGNLTAQFNDIGVMLAAGQNPLQLALQQGTQITQVIGPLGAAGAVRALGGAFLSLLSPINLVTIGGIAAGAAMVNWLTGAGEGAADFQEALDELSGGVEGYAKTLEAARAPTDAMEKRFGSAAGKARELLRELAGIERIGLGAGITEAIGALSRETGISNVDFNSAARLRDLFDFSSLSRTARQQVGGIVDAFRALGEAEGLEQQIALAELLRDRFREAAEARNGISAGEGAALTQIGELLSRLYELRALDENAAANATARSMLADLEQEAAVRAAITRHGEDSAEVANLRLAREREVFAQKVAELEISEALRDTLREAFDAANPGRDAGAERLAATFRQYAALRSESAAAKAEAEALLATLTQENAIREATIRYGAESAAVARLRAAQEREVLDEMLAGLDAAESLKDEIRAAFEAGQVLASTDMSGGISAAADEARRMADEILRAIGAAQSLMSQGAAALEDAEIRAATATDPVEQARRLGQVRMRRSQGVRRDGAEGGELAALDAEVARFGELEAARARADKAARDAAAAARPGGGGRGRATEETDREREAVERLIGSLEAEIAIARETDPVQRELLRIREQMAAATAGERAQIEELIRIRAEEAAAAEAMVARMDTIRDAGRDALDAIAQGLRDGASAGDILGDVLDSLGRKLIDLGTTGLADVLFGQQGQKGGGILGGFLSGLFKFAKGGVVDAPTMFGFGGGRLGLMGEAGPEAILPLKGGGVGAEIGGREGRLPLKRLASGDLGVSLDAGAMAAEPFARGGVFAPGAPRPSSAGFGGGFTGSFGGNVVPFARGGIVAGMAPPPAAPEAGAAARDGATESRVRVEVALSGDLTARVLERAEAQAVTIVQRAQKDYDRTLPGRVQKITRDPGYRGA